MHSPRRIYGLNLYNTLYIYIYHNIILFQLVYLRYDRTPSRKPFAEIEMENVHYRRRRRHRGR